MFTNYQKVKMFFKNRPYLLALIAFLVFFVIPIGFVLFYLHVKYLEIQNLSVELDELCQKLGERQKDLDKTVGEVKDLHEKVEKTAFDLEVGKEVLYKTAQDLRIARNDLFRTIYGKYKK